MKYLLYGGLFLGFLLVGVALCFKVHGGITKVDQRCMTNCMMNGYEYNYCKKLCQK